MSVREVTVIAFNMRNVDLHHRGLYRLRVRLLPSSPDALYTLAYGSWPMSDQRSFFHENEWTCRPVDFQYVDQKFQLLTACQFRADNPSSQPETRLALELQFLETEATGWSTVRESSVVISASEEPCVYRCVTFPGEYCVSVELGVCVFGDLKTDTQNPVLDEVANSLGLSVGQSGLETWLEVLQSLGDEQKARDWQKLRSTLKTRHDERRRKELRGFVVKEVVVRGTEDGEREKAVKREVAQEMLKEQGETALIFEKRFVDPDAPENPGLERIRRSSGEARMPGSKPHVIFLVHGLYGNGFGDFRIIREELATVFPDEGSLQLVVSESNEYCSDEDISIQGRHLASEVTRYLKKREFGRLSFVGFSMGGLVVRAALEFLEEFKSKLGLYLSLSSPHVGVRESRMVEMGLRLMRGGPALKQLTLADGTDTASCYLEMINDKLHWFQRVVLVGSPQDKYVHIKSALMEERVDMAQRILANVESSRLVKLEIHFDDPKKRGIIDGITGRHFHMMFLESRKLWQILCYTFRGWFD